MDYKQRLKDAKYPFTELTQAGKLDASDIAELGHVILGQARCREQHDDSVFFVTLGLCANDTAINYQVYQNAKKMGLGTEVYLWKEPRLF